MTLTRIKNHFGEHWPVWGIGLVTFVILALVALAIYGTIEESKQGWHYHSTCEEVDVPAGETSVTVWRCKGDHK